MKRLLVVLSLFFPASCVPSNVQPMPDASDAAPYWEDGGIVVVYDLADRACMHLAQIGCAQPATCAAVIRTKQGTFMDFKPQCLVDSKSKAEANACGTVRCP